MVHNGLDRLRHLGMNSTGLSALLSEPVNGYTIAAAILKDLQSPKLFAWCELAWRHIAAERAVEQHAGQSACFSRRQAQPFPAC